MGQITPVARRYGINRNTIHRWMVEEQAGTLMDESSLISPSGTKSLVDEVNKLKKLLGEKELENKICLLEAWAGRQRTLERRQKYLAWAYALLLTLFLAAQLF